MTINLGKVGFYLIGVLAIIYNFLVLVVHPAWLDASMGTIATVDTVLGLLGVGSFRVSIGEAWRGVDLGPVGPWIEGKKAYLSAISSAVFTLVTVFFGVSPATPWVIFVNAVLQVFGLSFGVMAQNRMMVKAKMRPPGFASAFKRVAVIAGLMLVLATGSQAQTFDNFWHPRPKVAPVQMILHKMGDPIVVIGNSILEFKPTAEVRLTEVSLGQNGASTAATFLNAFGPALTMQHSTQDAYGVNYSDWSLSLAFLASGTTTQAPVFVPEIALTVGFLNNLIQVGPSYALSQPDPNYSRIRIHVGVGINVTQN